jgi:exodeoxyribonuclease VII large subunit
MTGVDSPPQNPTVWSDPAPLTVSALNRLARERLESAIPLLWITGEVSNLTRAASGHCYFSLKDADCSVRCVMFRGRVAASGLQLVNGQQLDVRASATLYEARGEFQLQVDALRLAGLGSRFATLEALKQRLLAEGALDAARKRALPTMPRAVGIVTSPSGAAVRDLLTLLEQRMPSLRVVVYPTLVQGDSAPSTIAAAIELAGQRLEVDVLIVGRGGGSIEDLWAFNSEAVARAILACPLPVVSAVGHETDTVLSDLVADVRAPTPSAAATLVCPDHRQLLDYLTQQQQRLQRGMQMRLEDREQRLDHITARLLSPAQRVELQLARLAEWRARLSSAWLDRLEQRLDRLAGGLDLLSPHRVLERGYAWVSRGDGSVLRSVAGVASDERLDIHLADGTLPAVARPGSDV